MTATQWTDDKVERMKALWLDGVSAGGIARSLGEGVTRSAVLGKLHRLGVTRFVPAAPRRAAARPAPVRRAKPDRPASAPRLAPAAAPKCPTPDLPPQATLISVRRGQCRWPYGEPGSGVLPVCGRIVSRGAYCARHATLSYQGRRARSLFALAGLPEG